MNLLLRPAYFNPAPYRPKFRLEQQPPDEGVDWRIDDDEDIIAVIMAIAEKD